MHLKGVLGWIRSKGELDEWEDAIEVANRACY